MHTALVLWKRRIREVRGKLLEQSLRNFFVKKATRITREVLIFMKNEVRKAKLFKRIMERIGTRLELSTKRDFMRELKLYAR